ncbi:unnamed protein product [Prunus armeniaca]
MTEWVKPHQGFLKVNVDGALRLGSSVGGLGVVVRDSAREFVAGCAMAVENVFLAARVEALTTRMGISLVVERGPIMGDTKTMLAQITGEVGSRNHRILLSISYLRIVTCSFYGHALRETCETLSKAMFLFSLTIEKVRYFGS